MVILVPFLLVTAVFSRITILELGLPSRGDDAQREQMPVRLEVIVRDRHIEVADRGGEPLRLPAQGGVHDYAGLSRVLKAIKAAHPELSTATVLLEPQIPYEVLVEVMDATRFAAVAQAGSVTRVELFPEISVGDAPSPGESSG